MYEEIAHEQKMLEDMKYLLKQYDDKIDEANDILQTISNELWTKYGIEMKLIDLLKEM